MDTITREQIGALVSLQKNLSQILRARAQLEITPEKIRRIEIKIESERQDIEDVESLMKSLKKRYRDNEIEVETNNSKKLKSQEKLGLVKKNEEYSATLKEIDDITAINSRIEDGMIQLLETMEETEKTLAEKKQDFQRVETEVMLEIERLQKTTDVAQKDLEVMEERYDELMRSLDPYLKDIISRVKARIGQLVVVSVKNSICQGCHLNIPAQMFNELQACNRLMFCPFCQRIIYWDKWLEQDRRSLDPMKDPEESPNTTGQDAP